MLLSQKNEFTASNMKTASFLAELVILTHHILLPKISMFIIAEH